MYNHTKSHECLGVGSCIHVHTYCMYSHSRYTHMRHTAVIYIYVSGGATNRHKCLLQIYTYTMCRHVPSWHCPHHEQGLVTPPSPQHDCRPNAVTTKNTAPVARFLRSASDSTSGTVCIVQSGQRREGLRRSQKLTKHKCSHVNWRTGVGVAIAGLSCLEQSKQRKITM